MILLYIALRRALGRAQARAAKSCGVRGIFKVKNHFPALCGCFNLNATWHQTPQAVRRYS
jgi:hypothetical protein